MARIPKTAILLGAAVGLAAALRRRKPKEEVLLPDVEPPIPEDLPIPEEEPPEEALGVPLELVKRGRYAGQRGTIVWEMFRDPSGFFYEWKWEQNSGGGKEFPTLEAAETALLEDMQREVGPELDPAEIVRPLIARSGRPQSGRFYQIRKFDQLVWLAAKVLGVSEDHKYVIPALRCITFSDWNAALYGTKWDPDNPLFRKEKSILKDGQFTVLDKAFFPRHQNALSEMLAGRMPQRTIDNTQEGNPLGAPGANSFGMLWIPVMRLQGDALLCPEGEWPDGRLQSEPPPEVMAVLT
jgi:hypothetical protein